MSRKIAFFAAASFAASVLPIVAHAQAATPAVTLSAAPAAAPQTAPAKAVNGAIDSIDQTAKTFAVKGRGQAATITTVGITTATKYFVPTAETPADLKVGDIVSVGGAAIAAGDTTVTAGNITVIPTGVNLGRRYSTKPGFGRNRVTGTVQTATPTLTIKADTDAAITVTTTAATKVWKIAPGAWSDLAEKANVMVSLDTSATSPTAKTVTVLPNWRRRN